MVFFAQFSLIFFKHLNTGVVVEQKIATSMLLTFVIQASWLISTAVGVKAFIANDWIIIGIYLFAGVLGNFLNFKIKV